MNRKTDRRAALKMITAAPLGVAAGGTLVQHAWAQAPREAISVQAATGPVEPRAGSWKTWLLSSGSELRLPAPPDESATRAELEAVRGFAAQRDAAHDRIVYWDAGSAAYRWNEIAIEHSNVKNNLGNNFGGRALALVNVAIYDAVIAAWDSKYAYNRPRPSELDPLLSTAVPVPRSPSYPCEHAVAAGAASAVLGYLFPTEAPTLDALAEEAAQSRVLAGVEYPSDARAGLDLGRAVAAHVIEYAKADNSDARWAGAIPTDPASGPGPIRASSPSRPGRRGRCPRPTNSDCRHRRPLTRPSAPPNWPRWRTSSAPRGRMGSR